MPCLTPFQAHLKVYAPTPVGSVARSSGYPPEHPHSPRTGRTHPAKPPGMGASVDSHSARHGEAGEFPSTGPVPSARLIAETLAREFGTRVPSKAVEALVGFELDTGVGTHHQPGTGFTPSRH